MSNEALERSTAESHDTLVDLYRQMVLIRSFEDEVYRLFLQGAVHGSTHLCQGQEAVSVGACSVLRAGDTMTCTYRGHGAMLAMGAPVDRTLGEILGKADGLCRGKGGSLHLTDISVGALGSFAIVGAQLPFTVGAAFAARYRKTDAVSLAFFGDGAANIGAFHEALNLGALWNLPAVFVCENNLYGEYSPIRNTTPIDSLADRASSYGMESVVVDGNDVLAVRTVVQDAVQRARGESGPTLIEALTYRHMGHSRSDPGKYRPRDEVERWLTRDPLLLFRTALVDDGILDQELERVDLETQDAVKEASQSVANWEAPTVESRLEDVFA